MKNRENEKGAALVLVLGIVSVMSTMAIFSFDSLTRLISMTTAQAGQAQARQHALAAEAVAIGVTRDILKQKRNLRLLAEAGENRFVFSHDGARMSGEISDITNCFNLASLVSGSYAGGWQVRNSGVRDFSALLENFGLGKQAAQAISSAAADWQDSDDTPLALGAENEYYADLSQPYQLPNAPMASVKELRLIRDVSPKLMQALDDLLCADAAEQQTLINTRMLQPQHAPLVHALLGPTVSQSQLRAMLEQQPLGGYSAAQFWAHPALANAQASRSQRNRFGDVSRRVRLQIKVEAATGRTQMRSDIHFYPNGTYTMIAREFGAL